MRKFLKILRIGFICLPRTLWEYFTWILPYSRHPEKYPLEKRYAKARSLIIFLLRHMRFDVKGENLELLSTDVPALFVANHVGAIDPLILIALSPRPVSFIAKKEAERMFAVGRFIKAINGLFLDREDPFQAVKLFRTAKENMEKYHLSYCIFPEGTRIDDRYSGKTRAFHPGSFKIAFMSKSPIISFAQFGSFHVLDQKKGKSHPVQLRVLSRYEYEDYSPLKTVGVAEKLQAQIAAELPSLIQYDVEYYGQGKNKLRASPWHKALLEVETIQNL